MLLIGGAVVVSRHSTYEQKEKEAENGTETASVSRVVKQPADLTFWYSDESYQEFFEKAAEEYYEDTGIVVDAKYQDSMDYMDAVYTVTMQGEAFPDLYMIGSDELEEAYLYGLAAENTASDIYESTVAANAVTASTYKEKMYAYPLSYNTCLFVYKNGYFETEPETLQAIIDYSNDNEPPENVQYLLEWDVNDAFYDFPFISNSVSFVKDEVETMQVNYDEGLYNEDLEFFSQILESFSIDAATVTEESVISDFNEGKTLCAIVDSDSLTKLEGTDHEIRELLALNDTLQASSAALTDLVVVNDFSGKKEKAADFAEYVTLTMSGELHGLGGHYSVKLSEDADEKEQIAYQAYENAIPVPDSQDAKEFWVTLKETISQKKKKNGYNIFNSLVIFVKFR